MLLGIFYMLVIILGVGGVGEKWDFCVLGVLVFVGR